jgi:hypothetical protein
MSVWQPVETSATLYGYATDNPLRYLDPNGLSPCCDCPEKIWSYSGVGSGVGALVGLTYQVGWYKCLSKPELTVKVKITCIQGGLLASVNFASYESSATPFGIPGAKACMVDQLLEPQKAAFGGGKFGVGAGGDLAGGTGALSLGLGLGGGVGLQKCWSTQDFD